MVEFDYDSPPVPDTVVADVAAAIRADGKPPELSDEEKEQRRIDREIYLWKCRERDEERRAEYQEHLALEEAAAEHERRVTAAAAGREKARREYLQRQERQERQARSNDLAAIRYEAKQAADWRNGVKRALYQQQTTTLIGELEKMITAAPGLAETVDDIVDVTGEGSCELGDSNFNPALFNKKPRRWW